MQISARFPLAAIDVALVALGVVGCAAQSAPPLATCQDVIPAGTVADIFGDNTLVQLESAEPDSVTPLLDEMASEGVACGGDRSTSAVVIGQLAMDRETWSATRDEFAADGYHVDLGYPLPGAVSLTKGSEDVAPAGGFAWDDGILYYGKPSLLLQLVPALAPYTRGDPGLHHS